MDTDKECWDKKAVENAQVNEAIRNLVEVLYPDYKQRFDGVGSLSLLLRKKGRQDYWSHDLGCSDEEGVFFKF